MHKLINNFFMSWNAYTPLLHRPSFEHALATELHLSDPKFGAVLMMVCAIGARWTDDHRVYVDGCPKHSAGWKYFKEIEKVNWSILLAPQLYDLQVLTVSLPHERRTELDVDLFQLCCYFLAGTSSSYAAWTVAGVGIRLAQHVGAHRRKFYATTTIVSELWKRAFWYDHMFRCLGMSTNLS